MDTQSECREQLGKDGVGRRYTGKRLKIPIIDHPLIGLALRASRSVEVYGRAPAAPPSFSHQTRQLVNEKPVNPI